MVEGSPTDPPPASAEPEVTPAAEEEVTEEERTPEQVEAIWKNRVAGKDRAHAAEASSLRAQLDAEKAARQAIERQQASVNASEMSEAEQWKAKAEAAEKRAEEVERQRVLDVRSAKYAAAAEALDDPSALASMDEAKLAALNARLASDEGPTSIVDPNTPRRSSSTPPASPREKSVEDLESDLKKYAPDFIDSLP